MEQKQTFQNVNFKNANSSENIDSRLLNQTREQEQNYLPPNNIPQEGNRNPTQINQPNNNFEQLANSADSEIIRVSNLSHQSRTQNTGTHIQPVTHTTTQPEPIFYQQSMRAGKSHTQVIQPVYQNQGNRGLGGSEVQGWNGQLEQISRNIKDGRTPMIYSQGQGIHQGRAVSQSPQPTNPPIYFNYSFGNRSSMQTLNPFQPPQPQPHLQVQPYISLPPPPPHQIPQPIQMVYPNQQDQNQQILLWQSRYFTVIQRFQFLYVRIQTITNHYLIIYERIQNCSDPSQLQQLKSQMKELQQNLIETEQQLVEIVNRNKEILGDTVNWKAKFEELMQKHKQLENQTTTQEVQPELTNKLEILEKQLIQVKNNHQKALRNSEEANYKIEIYAREIERLNGILQKMGSDESQYDKELISLHEIIQGKDQEISMLRMLVEQQKSAIYKEEQPASSTKLANSLAQQKQELLKQLKRTSEELQAYKRATEQRIGKYEVQARKKGKQIQKYLSMLEEKKKLIDNLKQSSSEGRLPNIPNISYQEELRQLKLKLQAAQSEAHTYKQKVNYMENVTNDILDEKDTLYQKSINLQQELRSRNESLTDLQGRITLLEEQIRANEGSSKNITQNNEQLNEVLNKLKKQYNDKAREAEEYSNKYRESQRFLASASQEINEWKNKFEELNLKRSIQETKALQESPEITGLRQKIKNLERELSSERAENDTLRAELEKLERQARKMKNSQSTQYNQQYQLMEENIIKKDQQISKLRQTSQLLQTNVDQLSIDLQKIKLKASNDFKLSQTQKGQLKNQLVALQFKLSQLQRKSSSLQQIKTVMQQQMSTLNNQLHSKIQIEQRLQIQLKQQRIKTKTLQTELQSYLNDTEQIKNKLKDNQKKSQTLIKSIQNDLDKKKEEAFSKTSELALLNNKITELQNAVKNKDAHISELEKHSQSLKSKVSNFDSYLDQIKYLKQKITQYESKVSSLAFRPISRKPNTEPTQIFQRKVIYQLKLENEALKQQLGFSNKPTANATHKEGQEEVRERLTDFNLRLEEVIGNTFSGEMSNEQNQLFKKYQRDRRKLIEKHNQQISLLKVKIFELQSNPLSQYALEPMSRTPSTLSVYNEQILFYKEKNQELEEMVENHIKVNKELKDYVEKLMKGHSEEYSILYYKDQLIRVTELNESLQEKLKKTLVQLKKIKEEHSRCTAKPGDITIEFELRITELNRRISQLVLEINQFQQQKIGYLQKIESSEKLSLKLKSQNEQLNTAKQQTIKQLRSKQHQFEEELSKLNNKIRLQQSQIERLNEIINKRQNSESSEVKTLKIKINQLQEESRKLKIKIQEYNNLDEKYKREGNKYQNTIIILQADLQKYKDNTDAANRKIKQFETQINSLRITLNDYQNKIRSKDSTFEDYNYKETQLQQEIARLKSQVALLTQEIERINEFSQKKLSEKDTELQRIKVILNEKDQQISSLQFQINQSKIYMLRATEAGQEIFTLQEEITRLKNLIALKASEFDRKTQEMIDLDGRRLISEEQIKQLRKSAEIKASEFAGIISRLELQLKESQKTREGSEFELNSIITKLESQLREAQRSREQEINELKIKNYRLQTQIKELQKNNSEASQLHGVIINLEAQLQQLKRRKTQEISQLNLTISRLEQQLRQYQSKQQNSSQLTIKIRNLQLQLQEVTRKKDTEISQLNITINTLKNQLRQTQFNQQQFQRLLEDLKKLELELSNERRERQEERNYMENIIRNLQQHLQELENKTGHSEGTNAQMRQTIAQLQIEIARLKEQIKIKDTSLNQTQITLNTLQSNYRQLQIELTELRRSKQTELNQLQTIIRSLQQQFKDLQNRRDSSEGNASQLREQIIKLETQITFLKEQIRIKDITIVEINQKISVFSQQITVYESQINQYKLTISQLESNLNALQDIHGAMLHRSRYTIELLRSILISIEVLVEEQPKIDFAIRQTIGKDVACGLEECEQWHKI